MYKITYVLVLFIFCGCTGEKKEKSSREPSELNDTELFLILEKADKIELSPYWLEAEKREKIGLRFIAQDKSGAIYRFFKDDALNEEVAKQYILFKLIDTSNFSNGEKGVLFYQAGQYQLKKAVLLILKALENEKAIVPHISAASAFKEMKAQKAKEWLQKNLDKDYRDSLGSGSPFDESKREELLKISKEALKLLK